MKNIVNIVTVVIPVLVVIASLIWGVCAYNENIEYFETYKTWETTEGTVDDVSSGRIKRVTYTYEVEGKTYNGEDIKIGRASASFLDKGRRTTIWYNPEDPTMSAYWEPNPLRTIQLPLYVGIVFLVVSIINIFSKKKTVNAAEASEA